MQPGLLTGQMTTLLRNYAWSFLLTTIAIFINHILGFNTHRHEIGEYSRHAVTVIFWCTIFLTIVQIRAQNRLEHNFMNGFRYGCLFSVLYSASFSLFMLLYQKAINPQFYTTYREFFAARLKTAGINPELAELKLHQFDITFNGDFPSYVLLFLYMGMGGVIMSAIASAIFRNPVNPRNKVTYSGTTRGF